MGAVRIPLCASSWLGITTESSAANMAKYPGLGGQYQALITQMVDTFTLYNIVTIIDLHWNDDDLEQ
jgi:hypothetical protein